MLGFPSLTFPLTPLFFLLLLFHGKIERTRRILILACRRGRGIVFGWMMSDIGGTSIGGSVRFILGFINFDRISAIATFTFCRRSFFHNQ